MIYFLRCAETRWVKIGWAIDVVRRIDAIQQYNPHRLLLLAVRPGRRQEETKLHARFREYRRIGEWFEMADDVVTFIRKQRTAQEYLDGLPKGRKYVVSIGTV